MRRRTPCGVAEPTGFLLTWDNMFGYAACGRRLGDGLVRCGWLGFPGERGGGERIASSGGFLISAYCLLE